jgi:hypothetical protein
LFTKSPESFFWVSLFQDFLIKETEMRHRCDNPIINYLTLMTFDSHLWHIKTPEMTGTKSKFRSKFRLRLNSVPATGRNFSGILNLAGRNSGSFVTFRSLKLRNFEVLWRHLWQNKTPEMTVTMINFRRSFGLEANSGPSTDRNSAGVCNLFCMVTCYIYKTRARSKDQLFNLNDQCIDWWHCGGNTTLNHCSNISWH